MGPPRLETHSLDIAWMIITTALVSACALLLYLRAWGRSWWPGALMAAMLPAAAGGPATGRYLGIWIALLLVHRFLVTRRLRWLAATGVAGGLAAVYSLDMGVIIIVGVTMWSVIWGMLIGSRLPARRVRGVRPALAFLVGVACVVLPGAGLLWSWGILGDFVTLHREYMLVKPHYDKIPFRLDYILALAAPGAGVLGLWACVSIARRRDPSPLAGLLALLTLLNLGISLRTFDRSDVGHVIYAAMMAWPLLGTLVVWQWHAGRRSAGRRACDAGAFGRSIGFGVALISLAYLSPWVGLPPHAGSTPTMMPIQQVWRFYCGNVARPLCGPIEGDESRAFFSQVEQLTELTDAPGPWSRNLRRDFYEFCNQPAFYGWTGLTSPTRFFAPHYPSTIDWQLEVVRGIEQHHVRWVMWRGPSVYWNSPNGSIDWPQGQPNWLQLYLISRHLLRHFVPARHLAAPGAPLVIDGRPQPGYAIHDALVLERRAEPGLDAATQPLEPLWLEPVELAELPWVWGRNPEGAPPQPVETLAGAEADIVDGAVTIDLADGPLWHGADEIQLQFASPVDGRCTVEWRNAAGETGARRIMFNTHARFRGPYRVPVGSMPGWAWGGTPTAIIIRMESHPDAAPDSSINGFVSLLAVRQDDPAAQRP